MKKNSFTLLETIFAITILTLTISGSFALISRLLSFSSYAQLKLTASYLAQEGIEIIRNIRDNNWLDPTNPPWDDKIEATTDSRLDYKSLKFPDDTNCPVAGPLKFDGNFYNCSNGTTTPFTRKITISDKIDLDGDGDVDRMTVTVEVLWQDKSIKVIENLYSWK